MFKITRGNVLQAGLVEKNQSDSNLYPVYSSQTKDQGLMGYYKEYLYSEAITWTTDGANAGTVHYRSGKFYCTNVCGVLLSHVAEANKMIAEALNNVAKRFVSHVGNPKLMNNVMGNIKIKVPDEDEQKQIGALFQHLDTAVTLQQRKCGRGLYNLARTMFQRIILVSLEVYLVPPELQGLCPEVH